jgi:Flp pilus assembly protein TadD
LFYFLVAQAILGAGLARAADTAKSQPTVVVVKSPATAPADVGVVRVALKRLATIPRPGTELPDAASPRSNGSTASTAGPNGGVRPVPVGRPVVPNGKPVETAKPAAAAGQNSGPPVRADSPAVGQQPVAPVQPSPSGEYVYPSPYVYVPPPYVQMPLSEMSPADKEWNSYLSFGGRPGGYGYGYGYGYGPNYGDPYFTESWGDAYRFGFTSGYNYWRFNKTSTERQESVLTHALDAMDKGLGLFKQGNYRQAIDAFKLAAETNQGDPAARIYAAHSLFATGRYREAIPFLRRAFELQPKLALLDYDMRDDYGRRADFDSHLRALEAALGQSPSSVERLIMLGYVRYYSGQKDTAYEPLAQAKQIDPANSIPDRLLPHCTPPDVVLDGQKAAARPATRR